MMLEVLVMLLQQPLHFFVILFVYVLTTRLPSNLSFNLAFIFFPAVRILLY